MSLPSNTESGYVQFFVYKVPKSNRIALQSLLNRIVGKLKEYGTTRSEFYQLHSKEAFQGFAQIADTFGILPDEELWIELDHYRDRKHRDAVMLDLGTDANAGLLFRRLGPLVSKGYRISMGEFDGMTI